MATKTTRRLSPSKSETPNVQRLEQQKFARRLHEKLMDRGWKQSDLARRAFGERIDSRGYKVAKGRDRISVYLRGKAIPEPATLQLLADALDCDVEELAPDIHATAIDNEHPELAINVAAGHPNKVHLIVNKITTQKVAAQVFALLTDDG